MINTVRVIFSLCCRSERGDTSGQCSLNWMLLEAEKTPWLRHYHPCKKKPLGPLDSHTCLPNLVLFFLKHLSQVFEGSCSTRIFIPNIEFSSWKGPFWKDNEARARTTQSKWEGKIGFSQSVNSFLRSRVPVGQKGIPGWSAVSLCSSRDHPAWTIQSAWWGNSLHKSSLHFPLGKPAHSLSCFTTDRDNCPLFLLLSWEPGTGRWYLCCSRKVAAELQLLVKAVPATNCEF